MKEEGMIRVGKVSWFGGYNYRKEKYNGFGFIDGEIFFHKSVFKSNKADQYVVSGLENRYVLFKISTDSERKEASWVKLLDETSGTELLEYYSKNINLQSYFGRLNLCLEMLDIPSVLFLFRNIHKGKSFSVLKKIDKQKPEIRSKICEHLIDVIKWDVLPDIYLNDGYDIFSKTKDYSDKSINIIRELFPKWINEPTVLSELNISCFPKCIERGLEDKDFDSIIALLHNVHDQITKNKIAEYIPNERIIVEPGLWSYLSDEKKSMFINESKIDLPLLGDVLKTITPQNSPKTALAIGKTFIERGFSIDSWRCLSDPEKIWIIVYLSRYLRHEDWKNEIQNLINYENNIRLDRNLVVICAFEYLSIAFSGNNNEKQKIFDRAHKTLEKAIETDFLNNHATSLELEQLMCKCKNNPLLLCCARYWKKKKTIWCSENRSECCEFKMDAQEDLDYETFCFSLTNDNERIEDIDLNLANLLINVKYDPDLRNVYSPVLNYQWKYEEYPYRINGRINQLRKLFSHMHCRCSRLMKSNYSYSVKIDARFSITHAYCESKIEHMQHDDDVYLNECWNCGNIIDSRECHFKQTNDGKYYRVTDKNTFGYYVCMKCGAGVKNKAPSICPSCGCQESSLLVFSVNSNNSHREFRECKKCGYLSKDFNSEFEKYM